MGSDIRPRVSSNLVLKLTRYKMSSCTSETLHRGFWYPAKGYSLDLQITGPRTLAKDFQTTLQIQAQILNQISRSSTKNFRCAAGHLKCTYQIWCSNLLMDIDNINSLLPSQFKDQIWWNPQLDIKILGRGFQICHWISEYQISERM